MKENVGRVDRLARFVVGPGLVAVGIGPLGGHEGRLAGLTLSAVGLALLESAITRVCPFNALLGIDTRSESEKQRDLLELELGRRAREPFAPGIPLSSP